MDKAVSRREFISGAGASIVTLALTPYAVAASSKRTNVLLITADDLCYTSLGVTGCKIRGITPNLDTLAREGVLFEHAHVTSAVCQPSRSVLMTGRYPHRNGAMGFEPISPDVPTLTELLRSEGYFNGIMAKVGHLTPQSKFCWDVVVSAEELKQGRDPNLWYEHCKQFFEKSKATGKPFFLMANTQDPHRPFPGSEGEAAQQKNARRKDGFPGVSRTYKPEEADVPGFLPDIPEVRTELAQYYTAVHRCDEAVGAMLRALKESGLESNTLVVFLSDNGISIPYAKTNCYEYSTRTPLIVRWPGKVRPGSVNKTDLVSGVDFMPTVLDALGVKQVKGMDGRSFLPILQGGRQAGRDKVFTFLTATSAKNEYPMRCVRTAKYSYIFNAWSDGKTVFKNEPQGGLAWKGMLSAAASDPKIAERVRFFQYRVPEELYDLESDPFELRNLISDPGYRDTVDAMRSEVLKMMKTTNDPLLELFVQKTGKR